MMGFPQSSERRALFGIGASLATLASMVAYGLPAGAMAARSGAFGPHLHSTTSISRSVRPQAVAQLTQANFVVTNLDTNQSTDYQWSTVTPFYGYGWSNCNTSTGPICLDYGAANGPIGGSIALSPPNSPAFASWTSGTSYHFEDPSVMSVPGQSVGCTEVGQGTLDFGNGAFELDQIVFTAGPNPIIQSLALQVVCVNAADFEVAGTIAMNIVPSDPENGYYLFVRDGSLTGFGNDSYLTYLNGPRYAKLNANIVGMVPTPTGGGYWMVGGDGGVFSSGDAGFYGSTGNITLNKPVVGMAATPDGKGYWFVASDGGIFAYGDAGFYGSRGGQPLNKPIVGMAATPDGKGYWLVASDGGIFSYGDAGFFGSTGAIHLNQPVVGMTPTPSGHGYWFVAADGGIFAYGDAGFFGSTGAIHLNAPIVGMTATPDGTGYWFVASDGGVYNYGSAGFFGSLGGLGLNDIAGMSLGM